MWVENLVGITGSATATEQGVCRGYNTVCTLYLVCIYGICGFGFVVGWPRRIQKLSSRLAEMCMVPVVSKQGLGNSL